MVWQYLESWAQSETPMWGLRFIARHLLKWWVVRMWQGIRLFEGRGELQRYRPWEETVASLKTLDACFVTGRNAVHILNEKEKIRRLLLPNPAAASTVWYAKMVGDEALPELIRYAATEARRVGIHVRWLQQFCYYSFYIADRDELSPFVHVEFVLPGFETDARPALRISKRTHPKVFKQFVRAYEKLWNDGSEEID